MKNNRFVAIVLIPMLLLMLTFMVFPIFFGFGISFFDYNPLSSENLFLGFDNYKRLLEDDTFTKALINTLIFVALTVPLNIALSITIALGICTIKSKISKGVFRAMIFLPCIAPLAGTAIVWTQGIFAVKDGVLNQILEIFNIPAVNWMGSGGVILFSLILFTLWADVGYNTIIFTAGLDGIPTDFYEAADIDGANPIVKFFKITVPLLSRTTVFIITMTIISHFQMTVQFMIMAPTGGPNNAGMVLSTYIYRQAFVNNRMGYAAAISMVFFVIILVVTIVQKRINKVDWGY